MAADHLPPVRADLLPHLTTANIARDMDNIRTALGERTVSYYGISWGTYLGAIYRELFPATVDRMVLDSSVDPDLRGYHDFRTFSGAMEDRWPDLARFAVANEDTVGLGGTEREVRRNYLALTAALDRRPVTVPGTPAPINGTLVRLFTWQLSYSDAGGRDQGLQIDRFVEVARVSVDDEVVGLALAINGNGHKLTCGGHETTSVRRHGTT